MARNLQSTRAKRAVCGLEETVCCGQFYLLCQDIAPLLRAGIELGPSLLAPDISEMSILFFRVHLPILHIGWIGFGVASEPKLGTFDDVIDLRKGHLRRVAYLKSIA